MPPLVADRFGQVMPLGWGWGLRMSSPSRVLRSIEEANRAGRPSVLTVHPWEIDPDPPRCRLPLRLRFAHYFRLDGFRARLSRDSARRRLRGAGDLDTVRARDRRSRSDPSVPDPGSDPAARTQGIIDDCHGGRLARLLGAIAAAGSGDVCASRIASGRLPRIAIEEPVSGRLAPPSSAARRTCRFRSWLG